MKLRKFPSMGRALVEKEKEIILLCLGERLAVFGVGATRGQL